MELVLKVVEIHQAHIALVVGGFQAPAFCQVQRRLQGGGGAGAEGLAGLGGRWWSQWPPGASALPPAPPPVRQTTVQCVHSLSSSRFLPVLRCFVQIFVDGIAGYPQPPGHIGHTLPEGEGRLRSSRATSLSRSALVRALTGLPTEARHWSNRSASRSSPPRHMADCKSDSALIRSSRIRLAKVRR